RIVEILLAAPLVPTGGLQVTRGIRTDPDVGPGRRNDQRLDTLTIFTLERPSIGIEIGEAITTADAAPTGFGVGRIDEIGWRGLIDDHGRTRSRGRQGRAQ